MVELNMLLYILVLHSCSEKFIESIVSLAFNLISEFFLDESIITCNVMLSGVQGSH